MPEFKDFVMGMSVIALFLGIGLISFPVDKYRKTLPVGGFGTLLVVLGVVLATTFKWGDVAITISGLKLELRQARQQVTEMTSKLTAAETQLAAIKAADDPETQGKAARLIAARLKAMNVPDQGLELTDIVRNAGYTFVPTADVDSIPQKNSPNAPLNLLPGLEGGSNNDK